MALTLCLLLVVGIGFALYIRQRQHRKILAQRNVLLEQEKQLAELRTNLKEQELEQSQVELRHTKDELQEAAALLRLKNQLIEALELSLLQHAHPEAADDSSSVQMPAEQFSAMRILTKDDWKVFLEKFSEQFPDFMPRLQTHFPKLTAAEMRLFLLIKIGFETRQISEMLGISANSIWRSRHRLVKSLGIDSAKELDNYISLF